MNLSRFVPEASGTPVEQRPDRWPSWWWSRVELSPNTHRSFGHQAPLTRGWLHRAMALVWPLLVIRLALQTTSVTGRFAAVVFGLSMQAMFTASATTHLRRWGVWTTELLFRMDHVGIFLAIAGSTTPLGLLALHGTARVVVLVLIWAFALLGIVATLWPAQTPVGFGNTSFIGSGVIVLPAVPMVVAEAGVGGVALLLGGSAFYVVGAILLAFQRPRLSPRVFGYHEVWHTMVVVGVLLHYVMIERYFLPLA